MGVAKVPVCNLPLLYTTCPSVVPIIPLPGLALLGFPSGNGSKPIPYKTEKALFPEPVFHPTIMSITPILNMYQVAITMGYRHQPQAGAPIDAGKLIADTGKVDDYR
jgi:hypothetical protein